MPQITAGGSADAAALWPVLKNVSEVNATTEFAIPGEVPVPRSPMKRKPGSRPKRRPANGTHRIVTASRSKPGKKKRDEGATSLWLRISE